MSEFKLQNIRFREYLCSVCQSIKVLLDHYLHDWPLLWGRISHNALWFVSAVRTIEAVLVISSMTSWLEIDEAV